MVDPELFERYQRALGTNADLCKDAVEELLSKLEGLTPLEQAERLLANYTKLVQAYGKAAADVARQFYQEQRNQHFEGDGDASEYTAQTAAPIRESWAYEDVQKAASDGLWHLPKVAERRIMQRADQTIGYNVGRDPAHPRWAIVPHTGACGWCVMVASNGWAYSERSVNAQRHDGCKCSVAVDFDSDKPELAGYDVDALRRQYALGVDEAGDTMAQWSALSDEEKAKYQRKGRSAYDVFRTRQITQAMDARMKRDELDARMFELANKDAKKPLDLIGARKLADAFSASMDARVKWLNKSLTQEHYDETVGSLLNDIGRIYGMDVTGEFAFGRGLHSAVPNGDEIWAVTRLRESFKAVQFLSTDRTRKKGNPDFLANGEYADIKTLQKVRNTSDRIHEGYTQCVNRGQAGGVVVLSTLRLDSVDERLMRYVAKTVNRKNSHGQSVAVHVIMQDSTTVTVT